MEKRKVKIKTDSSPNIVNDTINDSILIDSEYDVINSDNSNIDNHNFDAIKYEYKTRDIVDEASTIQCKLNSIIKGTIVDKMILSDLFYETVLAYNKIINEGLHLFTVYILHLLSQNIDMSINESTICRCMRILIKDAGDFRSTGNEKEATLIKQVKKDHFEFNTDNDANKFIYDGDSFMKPLEAFAVIAMTNTFELVIRNFKKYQRKYIRYNLRNIAGEDILANSEISIVLNRVQRLINEEEWRISKKEDRITEILSILNREDKLNVFIANEKMNIKNIFGKKLTFDGNDNVDGVTNSNLIKYLKYFHNMLKFIETKNGERFPILPNFQPDMKFIHFEARSLYTIYCKWKNISKETIIPQMFEELFDLFLDDMFEIKKKYKKILKKLPSVRSISTNGVSISITFTRLKTIKYLADEEQRKIHKEKMEAKRLEEKKEYEKDSKVERLYREDVKTEIKRINKLLKQELQKISKVNKNIPLILSESKQVDNIQNDIDDIEKEIQRLGQLLIKQTFLKSIEDGCKRGLYDAEYLKCTEELLSRYEIIGVDPGNSPMITMVSESGICITIDKKYYYDLAHMTQITKKKEKMIAENVYIAEYDVIDINKNKQHIKEEITMQKIYDNLASTTYKTSSIEEYMKYVKIVRKFWNVIWEFYSQKSLLNMRFEVFTYKQKAITRICREIVKKFKNEEKITKPILLSFGKGNGSITISNTKGSSPKGAIKKLIKELSKYVLVILVPETNTSKLCCICGNEMKGVHTFHFPKDKEIIKKSEVYKKTYNENKGLSENEREMNAQIQKEIYINEIGNKIEETKSIKRDVHNLKNIKKGIKDNENACKEIQTEIDMLEKKVSKLGFYKSSYHLRWCANKHENIIEAEGEENESSKKIKKRCKMFERNKNAAINMIKMLQNVTIKRTKGVFSIKT
jgi:hypothetical protein